jgi:hypothetical protein
METKTLAIKKIREERVPLVWILAAGSCCLAWRLLSSLLEKSM